MEMYIIGYPSGEIIELDLYIFSGLKFIELIEYDEKIGGYIYKDENYFKIKQYVLIKNTLKDWDIQYYKIGENNIIDVNQNVDISRKDIMRLPFKFGKINGDFNCSFNYLKDLRNSPDEVTGSFNCTGNILKNLEYGPKYVGNEYICRFNNLINLNGYPEYVGKIFNCSFNHINNLKYLPNELTVDEFNVSHNNLRFLSDSPKIVKNFNCSYNNIITLIDGPFNVNGVFDCTFNKLRNIKGKPVFYKKFIYDEGNKVYD